MQKQPFPVGGGVKSLRTGGEGVKKFQDWGGVTNFGGVTFAGGSVSKYMPCPMTQ